jgi:hypothetical protein
VAGELTVIPQKPEGAATFLGDLRHSERSEESPIFPDNGEILRYAQNDRIRQEVLPHPNPT